MQDRGNRFQVVQNWLKANGVNLTEATDVYGKLSLLPKVTAARIEDAREKVLKPLVEQAAKEQWALGGGQLVDALAANSPLPATFTPSITEYLRAAHATERNREVAKVNPAFPDGGSGLTDQQASDILTRYRALPHFARFRKLAADFQDITRQTLALRVQAGLLDAKTAQTWEATYTAYVPLKGGPEAPGSRRGTGGGISVSDRQRRALGHTLRDENIIENIWQDHERVIYLADQVPT